MLHFPHHITLPQLGLAYAVRMVSNRTTQVPNKPRVLEKPARFNPPSHGSRRSRPQRSYGAALSDAELDAQKSKRYPNMMPPEGTLLHWLLTNRALHLWITLVSSSTESRRSRRPTNQSLTVHIEFFGTLHCLCFLPSRNHVSRPTSVRI